MTQTVPATAVFGPGKTGLTIGLRVLNLDGTVYAAFATTDVAETSTAGTYRKAGGVVAPLEGGYIVWGEAATDYAEATVESASANVTYWEGGALPTVPSAADNAAAVWAEEIVSGTAASSYLLGALALLDGIIEGGGEVPYQLTADALVAVIGADGDTLETLSDQLDDLLTSTAAIDNSGTYSYSNTIDDGSGNLLDGVYIQLATDSGFTNIVTITHSDASGAFTIRSDTAGTHYLRLQLAGYEFTDQTVTLA